MAAVAREPGAAAVPPITPPEPKPRDPAQTLQNLPDLPSLPLGRAEPPLSGHKDEDKAPSGDANEANEELLMLEANANAELMLQDLTEANGPLKPLSDPGPGAEQDPVQSAVSPLSLPAAPEAPEAGLSLGQPNGPDRACTDRTLSLSPERSERFTALREGLEDRPEDHPEDHTEPELRPGTHVRVALDHVIDDALVVSFRVGHKVFSGVLMDLSRRFGPYGIPITTFPPRRESSRRHVQAPPPAADAPPPPAAEAPPPATEAPPPLFHQGAPYPPPLFLRDSYHTSLPQPPPRRIKRSRRRYGNSEEPTCMLVRLRPRQVLCDRCKGTAGPRAPPVSTRRRHLPEPPEENLSAEVKRLRSDEPRPPRPRKEVGGGATRQAAARSSPRSTHSPAHRVLTRRISALTPPLTPPRVRLKPHRYRTDGEPQNQTRTRPGPKTRTPPPQTPRRTLPPRRTPPPLRPEPKPVTKLRAQTRKEPGPKPAPKVQTKPEPETRLNPAPKSAPKPAPESLSRSRRKQVFPRPTREFDLDFMGWSGPDSDLDLDRSEPRPESGPGAGHGPDSEPDSETSPESVKPESVKTESNSKTDPCPESVKPDPDPELRPDPDPEPTVGPAEPGPDPEPSPDPSSNPESIKPDPDLELSPEPEPEPELPTGPADPEPNLDPEPIPDSSPDPVREPEERPRSEPDSGPSSPAESESSSRSRSDPSALSDRPLEQRLTEALDSKAESEPVLSPDPAPRSGLSDPDPAPTLRPPSSRSGAGLGSDPPSSRAALQKCVGADGRLVAVGDIVWAKIAGFPWWPARVLSLTLRRRGDGGVASRREARVAWFGSRTTSLLPLSHSSPFLETFQTRFDRKRKGPYRRAVAEAAAAAKQLTPEARALNANADT